jgi:hypothetical protein
MRVVQLLLLGHEPASQAMTLVHSLSSPLPIWLPDRPSLASPCWALIKKISGGARSEQGCTSRDAFLRLLLTCAKLGLSFWDYLGHRLGLPARYPTCLTSSGAAPPLPEPLVFCPWYAHAS